MTITLRAVKGSALTHAEMDENFRYAKETFGGADEAVARGFWLLGPDAVADSQYFRQADRAIFGAGATSMTGNQSTVQGIWPEVADGPNWLTRDAQVVAHSTNGLVGILGMARSSDQDWDATGCIGVAGFALGDNATQGSPRGGYFEIENRAGDFGTALEGVAKNVHEEVEVDPFGYTPSGHGTFGLHLTTGDNSYGSDALYNPTAAININGGDGGNTTKWVNGIRFQSSALREDGSGYGVAVSMGPKHQLVWYASAGQVAGVITSTNTTSSAKTTLSFEANGFAYLASTDKRIFRAGHATNGVNNLRFLNAATGGLPRIDAEGDDTNVGIFYIAKGTGPHRFMSNTSTSNEEVRIGGVSAAPVNFMHIYGQGSGSSPIMAAAGSGTDLNVQIRGKGTGSVQLQGSDAAVKVAANSTGLGFFAATPIAKPTVSGAKGSNAALGSLLTALSNLGLITDSSSA